MHWTAGRYDQLFDDYHICIDGAGDEHIMGPLEEKKAHTYLRNSNAVGIALCCCYGASVACASEQRTVNSGQLRKDGPENNSPSIGRGRVDIGTWNGGVGDPPNEKQLNSVTVMLAILCLGLRLTVNEIKVLGEMEFVPVYGQLELTPQSADADSPPFSGAKEPAETLIRSWTNAALEEMKNGLYPSIDPSIAERPEEGIICYV